MKQRPSGKVMTSMLLVLGQMTFRWGLPPETFDIDIVALQIKRETQEDSIIPTIHFQQIC